MSIQFGFHIGPQNTTVDELRALWRALDEGGADWISVWDHLYEAPLAGGTQPHFEAVALLGALAADTKTARLGCLVFCAPYRNVGLLAKSAVTIDHLSGGRFELGLGSGWHEAEAAAFGLPFPERKERFGVLEEQLRALGAWRRGERVSTSGVHVVLDDAGVVPAPQGRLPLWVGGIGRTKTLRVAGALADGWNAAYVSPEDFRELNGVLDGWCEAAGRVPSDVERSVNLTFALGSKAPAGPTTDRLQQGALVGDPSDVLDQVAPYVEAGAQLVNVVLRPPWDPRAVGAYLAEAVPAMREAWS